ncbi:MAG TPA: hypothetical protein VKE26_23885 [Xanthobacteraceae bacterium]|nr:hypothetical protein [Xanthobacteraceae bacterium]
MRLLSDRVGGKGARRQRADHRQRRCCLAIRAATRRAGASVSRACRRQSLRPKRKELSLSARSWRVARLCEFNARILPEAGFELWTSRSCLALPAELACGMTASPPTGRRRNARRARSSKGVRGPSSLPPTERIGMAGRDFASIIGDNEASWI